MRYRKLSPTGDYTWGSNQNNFFVNEPAGVGQLVKTRLLLFSGEWYLDTDEGTPYFEGILGKHSQQMADTTIQDRILSTEGVSDISDFQSSLDPQTRAYSVTATIDTIYGPSQVEIQNYRNF